MAENEINDNFVEFMLKKAEKKEQKPEPYNPNTEVKRDPAPSQSREMTPEEIDNVRKFTEKMKKGQF